MALPNAYAQYKNSKVLTASPAELTLRSPQGASEEMREMGEISDSMELES